MFSERGEGLTGKGEKLAAEASEVMDAVLLADLNRRGGKRELQLQLSRYPLFVELREAVERKTGMRVLAVELLKFYEQSLAVAIARRENKRTGKIQNTQDFWRTQQEIKRRVLGSKFEEKKYLGIFVGLDFLAGQKIHYGNELDRGRLTASIRKKIEAISPDSNRKDARCSTATAHN